MTGPDVRLLAETQTPPASMPVVVDDIWFGYSDEAVLKGVSFPVEAGGFVALMGPNGSGKTTLLRAIQGLIKPHQGTVRIGSFVVDRIARQDMARLVASVPQQTVVDFNFTVWDMVMMGRNPYIGRFSQEGRVDIGVVARALDRVGISSLAHRHYSTLSGGEAQKVVIARALAQEPRVLLLDEPTAHLDINHKLEILDLIQRLNQEDAVTTIMVVHDINLAAVYCQDAVMLKAGQIHSSGPISRVISAENLADVYGCEVIQVEHPVVGAPQILLLPRGRDKQ